MKINKDSDQILVASTLILLMVCLYFTGLALLKPLADTWLGSPASGHGCAFLNMTGYPCPGCGASRSALAFIQGKWILACTLHPVLFILSLSMAGLGLRAFVLWFQKRPFLLQGKGLQQGGMIFLGMITLQWFWKCWVGFVL